MEAWLNVCVSFMHDYKDGIFLIILVLLFIIMLIVLKTVRKNNQNMRGWNAGIAKMTKALDEVLDGKSTKGINAGENATSEDMEQEDTFAEKLKENLQLQMEEQESRKRQQEEELFGKVLQEYFP